MTTLYQKTISVEMPHSAHQLHVRHATILGSFVVTVMLLLLVVKQPARDGDNNPFQYFTDELLGGRSESDEEFRRAVAIKSALDHDADFLINRNPMDQVLTALSMLLPRCRDLTTCLEKNLTFGGKYRR
jgi:hypothetical protein